VVPGGLFNVMVMCERYQYAMSRDVLRAVSAVRSRPTADPKR
jgi:hypothetical protein